MADNSYSLFIPPDELSGSTPREWSAKQADAYLRWLTGVIDERTTALLKYLGESLPGSLAEVEPLLERVGTKAVELLRQPDFSVMGEPYAELTNRGFAFAADLGLLVARLLFAYGNGTEQWAVLRRPKRDLFYNHPVITGLRAIPLEPVAGSIAEARGLLRGVRGADAWRKIFSYWHTSATSEGGGEAV